MLSYRTVSLLRLVSVVVALGLVASIVFSDETGLSATPGAGRSQIISASLAVLLLTFSILGDNFTSLYRGLGLVLLHILVAVCAIELLSFLLLSLIGGAGLVDREDIGEPGAILDRTGLEYEPYVSWSLDPEAGDPRTAVDADGCRPVPGASIDSTALLVFVYGSEAVLGTMVDDSATIPFFIQSGLDSLLSVPVRVVNRARPGWVSTQVALDLVLEIRDGNVPDLVVYIGGLDDVASALQSGRAGDHLDIASIRRGFERGIPTGGPARLLLRLLESTSTWTLISLFLPGAGEEPQEEDIGTDEPSVSLSEDIVSVFSGNAGFAGRLGRMYGFDCFFFWQPSVWQGAKVLTESETGVLEGGPASGSRFATFGGARDLLAETGAAIDSAAASTSGIIPLTTVLDSIPDLIFIGRSGSEMNANGNEIVARAVVAEIRNYWLR